MRSTRFSDSRLTKLIVLAGFIHAIAFTAEAQTVRDPNLTYHKYQPRQRDRVVSRADY